MPIVRMGVLSAGLMFSACVSGGSEPEGDLTIPPIDAEAPKEFKTATFAMG